VLDSQSMLIDEEWPAEVLLRDSSTDWEVAEE
jgi:hypothetical protein